MLRCGLIGKKLGHSYSPQIHGMLSDYEYRLYELSSDELEGFIKSGDWDGLNVTIPYKKAVLPLCDKLSPAAKRTGSPAAFASGSNICTAACMHRCTAPMGSLSCLLSGQKSTRPGGS